MRGIMCNRNYKKIIRYFETTLIERRFYTSNKQPPINHIAPSYLHNVGTIPLRYRSMGAEFDLAAQQYPDNYAIISCHENRKLTFTQVQDQANRLACGLKNIGLKPGDTIGIWSPNTCNWFITMIAAAKAGLILVCLNPALKLAEINYCLQKVGVSSIIAPDTFRNQNYYEMLINIRNKTDDNKNILKNIIIDSSISMAYNNAIQFSDLIKMASDKDINNLQYSQESICPDSPCHILFSSGTTGLPKAVLLSHFSIVNSAVQSGYRMGFQRRQHSICVQVPFFHCFGTILSAMSAIMYGATLVLPSATFNAAKSIEAVEKHKCNTIYGTPTMFVDLLAEQTKPLKSINSIDTALISGAPISPELYRKMRDDLGITDIKIGYGMTESTGAYFLSKLNDTAEQTINTVGHIYEHIEVKVIDERNRTVPFGESGELCVRGFPVMLEYLNDPEKTKEILGKDGWLKTGDKFILLENGYGKVVGRLKDIIIRGGENIFPIEIENFLNQHPNILESHVCGVPDERMGEEICVFIRLRDTDDDDDDQKGIIDADAIREFCRGQIAHFKIPKYIKFVQTFPKTASGKIQKFKLVEQFVAGDDSQRKV